MNRFPGYSVAREATIEELEGRVRIMMEDGWRCSGGMIFMPVHVNQQMIHYVFCQTMIREIPKE